MPAILLAGVGARQEAARALHGETDLMQELADMARMVANAELLLDHPGNQGRGPHPAVQAIGHWAAVENILQLRLLWLRQARRTPGAVALQQPLYSVGLIPRQPFRNLGSRCFQNSRQFATGAAFGVQHHGLQPLRHPVSAIALRFLTQTDQATIGLGVQTQQPRQHGHSSYEEYATLKVIMSLYLCA